MRASLDRNCPSVPGSRSTSRSSADVSRDRERATPAHFAQVLAEVRLQVGDAHPAHDLSMVMNGQIVKT